MKLSIKNTKLKTGPHNANYFWREWIKPFLVIALVTCAFRSTFADWNDVPTGSMKPTILEGDRVCVNKLAYDLKVPFTTTHIAAWDHPKRGEIVVFFSPHDGQRLVKRVVGVPGDTIAMRDNQLFINGESLGYESLPVLNASRKAALNTASSFLAQELLGDCRHPVMITPGYASRMSFAPVRVPAGQYFMMGDNRDMSFDSRYFGLVDRQRIIGRAVAVALSFDHKNYYCPRWDRFFTGLN